MVRFLAQTTDILLYTSLFTACCATSLCMATGSLLLGHLPPLFCGLHILVFGSTLVVYNAPRLLPAAWGGNKHQPSFTPWFIVSFVAGALLVVYGLWQQPFYFVGICALLGALGLAYSLPLLPFRNTRRLRDIGWLKISVLAVVWTTATAVLPVLYWGRSVATYPFEILLRFVFIFILCIVFDIRDVRTDIRNRINTLPSAVGISNSYRLINISIVVFALLTILQYVNLSSLERLVGGLLTAVATWMVIRYIRRHPSERAYLGLADGIMLLYSLLVILI
jgi:4-hydroxybenzoate polyprenyltransferase